MMSLFRRGLAVKYLDYYRFAYFNKFLPEKNLFIHANLASLLRITGIASIYTRVHGVRGYAYTGIYTLYLANNARMRT